MLDIDCYGLTGITKSSFEHVAELLYTSTIKSFTHRLMHNAIGLFMTK